MDGDSVSIAEWIYASQHLSMILLIHLASTGIMPHCAAACRDVCAVERSMLYNYLASSSRI